MASESRLHLYKDTPKTMAQLKNSIWLSDVGAYPVLVVVTFAIGMSATFISYQCAKNPDVRIMTGRRQQLIRSWDADGEQ
eukprot:CAMPEP_0172303880 /NCGR_PEP_ID=MMETSP1058-20130122/5393_1 /TAXON_ID=83371 /ORGANISM="Detonula confervacea, Strain CCMP 353" /LENGTH=79 /DNA_ID=CAMNT_0013014917 /DNA_START=110 /DNA_END=349 /DNA_ORIENTATION=+